MVHDLFLPGTNLWNEELLELNFYLWEAEAIKNIHVSQIGAADVLIWPHTPDGIYSVRSAYRLLAATQLQDQPSSSDVEVLTPRLAIQSVDLRWKPPDGTLFMDQRTFVTLTLIITSTMNRGGCGDTQGFLTIAFATNTKGTGASKIDTMVAAILTKLAYLIVPDLENLEAQADCNSEIEMTSIPQGVEGMRI
nr:hypothetical protein CFP56_69310 [Quercus suber]